jgi:hypothetical protein
VAQPFADKTQYSRCGCILANVPAGGSDAFGIIIVISTMLVWQIAAGSFQTKKADTTRHRLRKVAGQNLCDSFALHMVNGEAQYLERRHPPHARRSFVSVVWPLRSAVSYRRSAASRRRRPFISYSLSDEYLIVNPPHTAIDGGVYSAEADYWG